MVTLPVTVVVLPVAVRPKPVIGNRVVAEIVIIIHAARISL
jgi:hypothetical protein